LANMRARAEALGATLTIMSGNPGPGTEVKLSLRRKPRP
jgi:signal transduction histidine kinase